MVMVLVWGKEVVELYVELRYLQDTFSITAIGYTQLASTCSEM